MLSPRFTEKRSITRSEYTGFKIELQKNLFTWTTGSECTGCSVLSRWQTGEQWPVEPSGLVGDLMNENPRR